MVAGVVIAGVAALLMLWGLRGLRSDSARPSSGEGTQPAAATPDRRGNEDEEAASRWQEFMHGGPAEPDLAAATPRPIERIARAPSSPFDRAYAQRELARLGLRLEGVGRGRQALALISGRVVRLGDRIEGFRVESIDRSGVSLVGPNGVRLDLVPQPNTAPPEAQTEPQAEPAWRQTAPSARGSGAERRPVSEALREALEAGKPTSPRRRPPPSGERAERPPELQPRTRQRNRRPGS